MSYQQMVSMTTLAFCSLIGCALLVTVSCSIDHNGHLKTAESSSDLMNKLEQLSGVLDQTDELSECHQTEACLYGVLKPAPSSAAMQFVYKVVPTKCNCATGNVCYFARRHVRLHVDIYHCYEDSQLNRIAAREREQRSILRQYLDGDDFASTASDNAN